MLHHFSNISRIMIKVININVMSAKLLWRNVVSLNQIGVNVIFQNFDSEKAFDRRINV